MNIVEIVRYFFLLSKMPILSENIICIERLKGQFALYEFFSQTCSVKVAVLKVFQNS